MMAVVVSLQIAWAETRVPGAIARIVDGLHFDARRGLARDLRLAGVPAVLIAFALWLWMPGAVACAGSAAGLWGLWAMYLADVVDA